MRERRRATRSHFVELLRKKRGKKRVPMRELAVEIDRRLYLLARAQALFTRAVAQGLSLLSQGGGLACLGYRNLGDYVTERLGMSVRQAQQLRAVAEGLKSLPHVDAAWARGDLKYCVVRLLAGKIPAVEDELWAVAGRHKTENQVRELMAAWEDAKARGEEGEEWRAYVDRMKAGGNASDEPPGDGQGEQGSGGVDAGGGASVAGRSRASEEEAESRGHLMQCRVNPDVATKWYVALEIARRQAGHDVAAATMLEAAMAEFMVEQGFDALARAEAEEAATRAAVEEVAEAACGVALAAAGCASLVPPAVSGLLSATSERTVSAIRGVQWETHVWDGSPEDPDERDADWGRIEDDLAEFNDHWAHLSWSVPSLRLPGHLEWTPEALSPQDIDARLRALMRLNQRNDFHLMDLLFDLHVSGLFVDLEFTSIAHYVQERLGLSATWCKAGLSLAWTLRRNPAVAQALREGRLNQGQARLVCRVARAPWIEEWIKHARRTTVRFLKEDVEAAERLREEDLETFDGTGGLPQDRPGSVSPPTRERTGKKKADQEGTPDDIAGQGEILKRVLEEIASRQRQESPGAEDTASGSPTRSEAANLGAILAGIVADSAAGRGVAGAADYNEGYGYARARGAGSGSDAAGGGACADGHICAPGAGSGSDAAGGGACADGHICAPGAGSGSDAAGGGACADGHICAPGAGSAPESAPGGASADGHIRAPGAGSAPESAPGASSADGHNRAPTPLVPPGLSFKQQLKHLVHAYASGKCTNEFWKKSLVRLRFWLPEAQQEAWNQAQLAVSVLTGPRRETAFVDQVIEHLVDAFLREWAAKSLEEIKKHPILEAGGWKCSVPTCSNRAWLEDHHIEFLSRGGSNHPSNRASLCWFHHHQGVHAGRIILEGTAPGDLMWRIGVDDKGDHMIVWGRQIVETVADAA